VKEITDKLISLKTFGIKTSSRKCFLSYKLGENIFK
jgi:hypothetical protein